MRKIMLPFITAVMLSLVGMSALASPPPASTTSNGPVAFVPELILYKNGKPAAIQFGKMVDTIQECLDALTPTVAGVNRDGAAAGVQANGGCFPIPPAPAMQPKPAQTDPLNPESFQKEARG